MASRARAPYARGVFWLLEPDVFGPGPHPLTAAAKLAGHAVLQWDDEWWNSESFPAVEGPALFHGSLGNASRIAEMCRWSPGAFCNTAAFACSRWYSDAKAWLVQDDVVFTTVAALTVDPLALVGHLADDSGRVFVRPDSPLKPFSGRVVALEGLTPAVLDHGFYYEDLELPVVVSRTQSLGEEWRFVVCGGSVLTGCRYEAQGRRALDANVPPAVQTMAEAVATELPAPDSVYGLDLVQTDSGPRLLELNPFSGMDLYACDLKRIAAGVSALADQS